MHLYPELCDKDEIDICEICKDQLENEQIPKISISSGFDLGSSKRAQLPDLSWAEILCISQTRVLSTALNIRIPKKAGHYSSFKGHCVAFPDNAALSCANDMPDFNYALESALITVEGPKDAVEGIKLDSLFQDMGALRVNAVFVMDWLRFLYFANQRYGHISIKPLRDIELGLNNFKQQLIDNVVLLPYPNERTADDAEKARSDITKRAEVAIVAGDTSDQDPKIPQEYTFESVSQELKPGVTLIQERFAAQKVESAAARILGALQGPANLMEIKEVKPLVDVDGENLMDTFEMEVVTKTEEVTPLKKVAQFRLHREPDMLSIFDQMDTILYGAFPNVFLLGKGIGLRRGPLEGDVRSYLQKHYSRRPATDQLLIAFLHNVKMRSDNGRVAAATVRSDSASVTEFCNIVNSESGQDDLKYALIHPDSARAKSIVRKLAPLIMLQSSKVPYSPLERGTAAASELFSLCRYHNLPNCFLTIGPNETCTAIIARMVWARPEKDRPSRSAKAFWEQKGMHGTYSDIESFDFEANLLENLFTPEDDEIVLFKKQLADDIRGDVTAVALMCHRCMQAVNECLFGIPKRTRRTCVDFSTRPSGVFGRARASFNVSEVIINKYLNILKVLIILFITLYS